MNFGATIYFIYLLISYVEYSIILSQYPDKIYPTNKILPCVFITLKNIVN